MVHAILRGRTPFPKPLIPKLRAVLKIEEDWDEDKGTLNLEGNLVPDVQENESNGD